jgi:hypothetical protein
MVTINREGTMIIFTGVRCILLVYRYRCLSVREVYIQGVHLKYCSYFKQSHHRDGWRYQTEQIITGFSDFIHRPDSK